MNQLHIECSECHGELKIVAASSRGRFEVRPCGTCCKDAAEIERLRAAITRYVRAVEASNTNIFEDGTASVGALAVEENRAYLVLEKLAENEKEK